MTATRALAFLLLLVPGLATAQRTPPEGRCVRDALDTWHCAADPKGTAVLDVGAPVCAPGRCVRFDDEWRCSSLSGGNAVLTPDGPVCDGGCRTPRAVECKLFDDRE
jgi:hypothetical protein